MAKHIIWTDNAEIQLEEILTFWIERTKSYSYSIKISSLIFKRIKWISETEFKGSKTTKTNVSVTFINYFGVFYELTDTNLYIYAVWDTRRNPDLAPF